MAQQQKNRKKTGMKNLGNSSHEQSRKIALALQAAIARDAELKGFKLDMQQRSVPTKKQTKIAAKLTKGTQSSFNAAALKGVPGGHWFKMAHAEHTGTQTMSHERSAALTPELSRMHCYTTKSAVHHYNA